MKVLICGSRNWEDDKAIEDVIFSLPKGTTVISGGALGADNIAEKIALSRTDLGVEIFHARWDLWGKSAGPKMNIEMLDQNPDIVYAFPLCKSVGTNHTIREAKRRGI